MGDEGEQTTRVLIEVDIRYVEAVYNYVAALQRGTPGSASDSSAQPEPELGTRSQALDLNPSQITHLARSFPYRELGILLDELAAHPGQWVLKQQVERDYGLDANVIKSQLAGMTKRFIPRGAPWFFKFEKRNGLFWYCMTEGVAQAWSAGRPSPDMPSPILRRPQKGETMTADSPVRKYEFCAKCGLAKDPSPEYVHDDCLSPTAIGAYHYCAACGQQWDSESTNYVCEACLVR